MCELEVLQSDLSALVKLDGTVIGEYSATSNVPGSDTPKPYWHPLRTPAGVTLTGFAPDDHPWHHGLQFAFPRVGDHNLWGGGTYFGSEKGYVVVEDQGSIRHERWLDGASNEVAHELLWVGHDDEPLIRERRRWSFEPVGDAVVLDLATSLNNVTGADLPLQTPAQRGRDDGGYGGLFLRLAEGFAADRIIGDSADIQKSGAQSDTLVVHGHTASGDLVTLGLSFRDSAGNRKWLYRFEPFAAIGWAIAYDDGMVIQAGESLSLNHRLIMLDGHINVEKVQQLL